MGRVSTNEYTYEVECIIDGNRWHSVLVFDIERTEKQILACLKIRFNTDNVEIITID